MMDFLTAVISEETITEWELWLGNWIFYATAFLLLFELIRYRFRNSLSWNLVGDAATNFITLIAFIAIAYLLLGVFYIGTYYLVHEYITPLSIPTTVWSVGLCIVLADLAYYWEHRFTHRVGIAWATHTVHHSSPYFNMSVAYRFGPLDGFFPLFFHLPLVLVGFHPLVVLFAEAVVQLYQTPLHTEAVGKLPKPVEAVMNTPSHHRVHHGTNPQYIDKNYGGIFIVWDRLFGTFEEEQEKVIYGISEPLNSINPFVVFLHGFSRITRKVIDTPGLGAKFKVLIAPP